MKRLDIQALRGFAVLSVLLFHVQIAPIKGGFLGVDIFFVISGFVITQRLARAEGSFKEEIIDFYKRRAKRILPASLLVILITALFTRIFLAPISFHRFGFDGLATTFFGGNFRFAAQGNDYLNQSASPTPYLHYWSLGVEEQFYLIWPVLFLLFFKSRKKLVLPLFVVSTLFAIWYTHLAPVNSFYLPISRAWEFLAGIVVALLVSEKRKLSPRFNIGIAILGWLLLIASIFTLDTSFATPGFTTLIPVLATAAILSVNVDFFFSRVAAWLGNISFSVYLIHWPLVVIALQRYGSISHLVQVELILAAIAFGWVLATFVEYPFRFKPFLQFSFPKWAAALVAISAILFASSTAVASNQALKIDTSLPSIYKNGCHLGFGISLPTKPCLFGDITSPTEVVLVGDSHAAQWFPALEALAVSNHWKLLSLTKSSCPAVLLDIKRNGVLDSSCSTWQKSVAARIKLDQPAHVFIANFTEYQYQLAKPLGSYATDWVNGQSAFIKALAITSDSIDYLEDTPRPTRNIPDCLSKTPQGCDFKLQRSATTRAVQSLFVGNQGRYLSFTNSFCPDNKCAATLNGYNVYRDSSHISVPAALALMPGLSKKL